MNRNLPGLVFASVALTIFCAVACGEERGNFGGAAPREFGPPGEPDAGCPDTCSLDGRSVVRCTGEVLETCPPERACGNAKCQDPCAAAAANQSSNGCEFYLQPPLLVSSAAYSLQSCYAAYVVNTSTTPVEVALEFEGKDIDISQSMYRTNVGTADLTQYSGPIGPGDGVVIFVSDSLEPPIGSAGPYVACPKGVVVAHPYDYFPTGTQFGSSFHLRTTVPVSAATIFPFGGARSAIPTATLLLPVATWSTENILINPWEMGRLLTPGAQLVASEDDTEITILPTRAIQDGQGVQGSPPGVPAHYHLDKGQFIQFVQPEELTGSRVSSTRPISIFGGHTCADIPSMVPTCDLLNQQLPAYGQWGSEYVGVGYRPRTGDELEPMPYRIVAAQDGTRLDYDPEIPVGAPTELHAGEVATFATGVGTPFVVRTQDAEHPIYVAAYMSGSSGDYWQTGRDFASHGDPDFVNVVPSGQYLNSASFYADPTYGDTSLVIVRSKIDGAFKDVNLECLGGPVTDFRPIGTRGDYEFARVDLSKYGTPGVKTDEHTCYYGAHRLRSDGPFTATIWGWDFCASYAYSSGMATRKLVATPLDVPR